MLTGDYTMSMREPYILASLIAERDFGRRSLCIPHYTPTAWWECDLVELTKSGFLVEYEIKTSRSDFLADQKKREGGAYSDRRQARLEHLVSIHEDVKESLKRQLELLRKRKTKHQMLTERSTAGPCRFWFVMPEGLVDLSEIPDWAGLYTVKAGRGRYGSLSVQRPAPQLHRQKVDPQIEQHMRSVCYYRMLNYILRDGQGCQEKTSDGSDAAASTRTAGKGAAASASPSAVSRKPLPHVGPQSELWRDDRPQLDPAEDDSGDPTDDRADTGPEQHVSES